MMNFLSAENFRHHIDRFNAADVEDVVNLVSNAQAFDWISTQAPLFSCPDPQIEKIYYYRWWTFRKHLKQTPAGTILTEFILPVKHAGSYNAISCALGHHIAEGRWLKDQAWLDQYIRFWFRSSDGKPEAKFHKYSQWIDAAVWERYLVTHDDSLIRELIDDLVADYAAWEAEKQLPGGLFWQFDVWDGMEESISGSRRHKNLRPTINSYMYANAAALAEMGRLLNRPDLVQTFSAKAAALKQKTHNALWDGGAQFFKAQTEEVRLSDAREEIGFIPWCFNLPEKGLEAAWGQLIDPRGFLAPFGITTAERRHPRFRSHGVGQCEWDGAVWPFATSQTLVALANVLRHYPQTAVTMKHYLEAIEVYARCHHYDGKEYIGEYLDETTGAWLKGDNPRSRYYNHSTYADLIIGGLVGIVPQADDSVRISPLLPADSWDWFALQGVPYHGKKLTVAWDREGNKFGRGTGLSVLQDETLLAQRSDLGELSAKLK